MSQSTWQPHDSLTQAPTNLKEAIDWVLRVTGRDGNPNKAAAKPPNKDSGPHCLCYLAKAVKDLLYDSRSPGSPGPHPDRYWDNILLTEESTIVNPVLTDLGLLSVGSTSAARDTCAGGTEVIRALIDHLAQGLQKWVGWKDGEECCLNGTGGIGKKCDCTVGGAGANCCNSGGSDTASASASHECKECGNNGTPGSNVTNKCYQSAYKKESALWTTIVHGTPVGAGGSVDAVKAAQEVHLLARIFLGSVCLIWSGLSQLGFLTGKGSSRWEEHELAKIDGGDKDGLGSFMAAMGYDLDRLNGSGGGKGNGEFVQKLLSGTDIKWQEFKNGADKNSVAKYYSSIYSNVKSKNITNTESLCKDYPLLVLHILASGYFRAGSAGAKGVTTPPKAATTSDPKKDNGPRKPRTIREILYWLSALPYSQGYCQLVERMGQKYPPKEGSPNESVEQIVLHGESLDKKTDLKRDCITHYLMAACGYCPLVLIGIQGTIEREVDNAGTQASGPGGAGADQNKCPEHSKDRSKRCTYKEETADQPSAAPGAPAASAPSTGQPLGKGQVCYGGYHLEVSSFGPLHGMYANGLFGFQMDMSSAQCLDQLRTYVYHCFYQLYFLRKQCSTGVVDDKVLGWQSCRYGSGVSGSGAKIWICETKSQGTSNGDHTKNCGLQSGAGSTSVSALQSFLCDSLNKMNCTETIGKDLSSGKQSYPEIEEHMNKTVDSDGKEKEPHKEYPELCPVPMGWDKDNHFKDLNNGSHKKADLTGGTGNNKYPAHCTGNTLFHLLEYYCDPEKSQQGTLVVLLRLLACITPTVPRTLGDLFGFYYYVVYIGGNSASGGEKAVQEALGKFEKESKLHMPSIGGGPDAVVKALTGWTGDCNTGTQNGNLKCLYKCPNSGTGQCCQYLSPLSGQQYGQLSPLMAGTYLSWLVYLIEGFKTGLEGLAKDYRNIVCKDSCSSGPAGAAGCGGGGQCQAGTHGTMCSTGGSQGVCQCTSVVSCTGVLPVLYKYGFGYGSVTELHKGQKKQCHMFLETLKGVLEGNHLKTDSKTGLHHEINQLIYTTRLPWIFVLTLAWLMAVLYLAFGAIWPLDWAHMRSHCRGWFRKGSLSPWEVLMVGKKKGRGILEFFGGR
uniref:Putative variant erythrocyte surface antigen-1a related protein n=3 Tax=Babesia bovis TaxID=5865 RepID=Q2LIX4_BABBO|nr:putative variant erythrocyte surface antigen-1a related protein [Babesia bovis]